MGSDFHRLRSANATSYQFRCRKPGQTSVKVADTKSNKLAKNDRESQFSQRITARSVQRLAVGRGCSGNRALCFG